MNTVETDSSIPPLPSRLEVRNLGEPIRLRDINLAGITAEAKPAEASTVRVWTRLSLTSDEALFHRIIHPLAATIRHSAEQVGSYKSLDHATMVLLVIRPDNTGELWIDTAAILLTSYLRRSGPLESGTVLFESDIADVNGLWFPAVDIGPSDRILCIMREGWRFALFFDFNREGYLSVEDAKRELGTLYRRMKYADLYAAMGNGRTFDQIISAGWFPFLELMSSEFRPFVESCDAGFDLAEEEANLVQKFDDQRLERMFSRWMGNSNIKSKERIFRSAINAFKANDPISVIKIVLTEIEGVLSEAYFKANGERTHRIERILKFAIEMAEQRAGKDTLFFPREFAMYLKRCTFAGFKPGDVGSAGSRNAVGHGAVPDDQYTMPNALKALLTLDQFVFYT